MAKPHILMVPLPAQGHVTPMMELSHRLVEHGFEVTFVNTEEPHARVVGALQAEGGTTALAGIHLASIPDGLELGERLDVGKVADSYDRHIPGHLERLIAEMEASGRPKVNWIVCDVYMWPSFVVAKKFGIRVAALWPAAAACLAFNIKIPKLIKDGFVNDQGLPERDETVQLAPGVPPLHTSQLPWINFIAPAWQRALFELGTKTEELSTLAEVVVCNSFRELEAGAFTLLPKNVLPVGPLTTDPELRKPVGQLLPEDTRCLPWLDAQPDGSVVYVAFGSSTIFDPRQFRELAEGLELADRPFLWVVRADFTTGDLSKEWFDEFKARVAGTGMVVSWCPQQKVLAHHAVACFVSHCGWNSTVEGARSGVPFLCWPYFSDQFLDRSYVTDVWRTGLAVSPDADGIVTKEELKSKVEKVVGDSEIRERARLLRDAAGRAIDQGGDSYENIRKFVDLLRQ